MKVIYDEAKAIATKQEIDSKYYPELNPQLKKKIRLYRILSVLGYLLACWGVSLIERTQNDNSLCSALCYLERFVLSIVFIATWCAIGSMKRPKYPASVQYHTAIQDKKILRVERTNTTPKYRSKFPLQDYTVCVTLEDAENIVTTEDVSVCDCTEKNRTGISEVIFDLDEKIIYRPYGQT